jgi:hypothetical protein
MMTMSDSPVPPGFRPVPPFDANEGNLMLVTILLAIFTVVFTAWAFWEWRTDKTPLLPLMLVSSIAGPWIVEPPLDIVSGLYMPAEWQFRIWTVLGRPMPVADLLVYVIGAAVAYLFYRWALRGATVRQIWLAAGGIAVLELAIADYLLIAGHGWLYVTNPVEILGLPIYVPFQYAGFVVFYTVLMVVMVPHLRGVHWLWSLAIIPLGTIAFCTLSGMPVYMAIHSDYPAVVNWALGLLTVFLCIAVPHYATKLEQFTLLRTGTESERAASPQSQALLVAEMDTN